MYNTVTPIIREGWESSDVATYFTITSILVFTSYICTALFGSRVPMTERILLVVGLLGSLVMACSLEIDWSDIKVMSFGMMLITLLHCIFLFVIPSVLFYLNVRSRPIVSEEV